MGVNEKNELIQKLEAISSLQNKAKAANKKMNDFVPDDNYKRKVKVPAFPKKNTDKETRELLSSAIDHCEENAAEQMSAVYDGVYAPQKPEEPKIKEFQYSEGSEYKDKQAKLGCFSYIAAAVSGFFLLSLIIGSADGAVGTIVTIAIISALLFAFFRYKINTNKTASEAKKSEALAAHTEEVNNIKAEYEEQLKAYESELNLHKLNRQEFLDEYVAWRNVYLESVAEEAEIAEKLEADRVAGVEKIEKEEFTPVIQELATVNNLLTLEYLPAVDVIIDLLKGGRADDLKEAINLYEDIIYRERQLQLEREKEEQRQREEQRRRQDEERRYQEEKQFREDQERQRQREAEQQRADEERRYREEVRARKESEAEARKREYMEKERLRKENHRAQMDRIDQERKQRDAGQAQCRACIHCGHCNMSIHNNAPTCTGFRPR